MCEVSALYLWNEMFIYSTAYYDHIQSISIHRFEFNLIVRIRVWERSMKCRSNRLQSGWTLASPSPADMPRGMKCGQLLSDYCKDFSQCPTVTPIFESVFMSLGTTAPVRHWHFGPRNAVFGFHRDPRTAFWLTFTILLSILLSLHRMSLYYGRL